MRLLESNSLADISCISICTEAEVSRSSFYAYYESKYDVLTEIEQELIDGFLDIMISLRTIGKEAYYGDINKNRKVYFTQYFQYIKAHYSTFKVLLNQRSETGFSVRFSRAIS